MKNTLLSLVTGALLSLSVAAPAKEYVEPPIKAGFKITVQSYDAKSKLFSIKINDEPEVGPNYATPEALTAAVGAEEKDLFARRPNQTVGNEYSLQADLKLLSQSQAKKRGLNTRAKANANPAKKAPSLGGH